jgi:hypothetical protein
MDQYKQYNTDPNRPLLVVLHHDGDNFGGGSEAYYHGNFQNMVNWAAADPDYDVTTIQDYLDRFPVPAGDVIHVEPGSWAGADNGDPQFKKWLGPRNAAGWSPDQNSWAVLTAAKNRVFTAEDKAPIGNLRNVLNGVGSATEKAWHFLLQSQASAPRSGSPTSRWDPTWRCSRPTSCSRPIPARKRRRPRSSCRRGAPGIRAARSSASIKPRTSRSGRSPTTSPVCRT